MKKSKKPTRAEKVLLTKIANGQMPGKDDNRTADRLLAMGLVTFDRARTPRYSVTATGAGYVKGKDNVAV